MDNDTSLQSARAAISFVGCLFEPPDFIIKLGEPANFSWKVHTHVPKAKSSFFARLIDAPFKEGLQREVTLHEDDPFSVARMIIHFYMGAYPYLVNETCSQPKSVHKRGYGNVGVNLHEMLVSGQRSANNASFSLEEYKSHLSQDSAKSFAYVAAEMVVIADKYGVSALRLEGTNRLEWDSQSFWDILRLFEAHLLLDDGVVMESLARCITLNAGEALEQRDELESLFQRQPKFAVEIFADSMNFGLRGQ